MDSLGLENANERVFHDFSPEEDGLLGIATIGMR
jgi:hypothetical protein